MKLYLFPTPISEAGFVPDSAMLEALSETTHFLCEHPRTARRYLSSLNLPTPVQALEFFTLSKKTPSEELHQCLNAWEKLPAVGVLSEAGCPGVADPGARAVQWAHTHGHEVVPFIGPSSLLLALMASGANGQAFTFHGYLPVKVPERKKAIQQLAQRAQKGEAQLCIETPYRNTALFEAFLGQLPPETRLCVACNLTAPDAFVKSLPIKAWRKVPKPDMHKKPTVFIVF